MAIHQSGNGFGNKVAALVIIIACSLPVWAAAWWVGATS